MSEHAELIGKTVQLVGRHPHRGEEGVIAALDGPGGMILITLSHCAHGVEQCYGFRETVRLLTKKLAKLP